MIRNDSMSSRNSAVSRIPSTIQSSPSRAARSSSGSSMSVTFCTYVTGTPASRQPRTTRSNAIIVAAWPRWVASYGVMPHTYILAPPGPGRVGATRCRAVSYSAGGATVPGSSGTSGPTHDSIPPRVTAARAGPPAQAAGSDRRPGYGRPGRAGRGGPAGVAQPPGPPRHRGHLRAAQVGRQRLPERALLHRLDQRLQHGDRRRRQRRAGPAPQHGTQLRLHVEADAVVDPVEAPVLTEQHVPALAVGVVDH